MVLAGAASLALAGNALAWNSTVGGTATVLNRTVHVNDGMQIAATCPTFSPAANPNPMQLDDEVGVCTHWQFNITQTGTLTITVYCATTPPSSESGCDAQNVEPALCLINSTTPSTADDGITTGNCPGNSAVFFGGTGETEVVCTPVQDLAPNGAPRTTLTCPVEAGRSYELILAPSPVNTCPPFDMMHPVETACLDGGPGIEAQLRVDFVSATSVPADTDMPAIVVGAAMSNDKVQRLLLFGFNDPNRTSWTRVYFERRTNDSTRCRFEAGSGSVTAVPDSNKGGTADLSGQGYVWDSQGVKRTVSYNLHVTDGGDGQGSPDTYRLSAPGCDTSTMLGLLNTPVAVDHGKIQVIPVRHWHSGDH